MVLNAETKDDVLNLAEENNVKFIRLWFTDIKGKMKSFAITRNELELALEEGMGFDGSSIEGYRDIEESDMIAMPDPTTMQLLPWRSDEKSNVAAMFCDVKTPEGDPYEGDPRYILRRQLEKVKKEGYTFYVGPECEYFYFADSCSTTTLDSGGYFDLVPLDVAANFRRDTIYGLESMGITVEYSHHEVAPSQHEIDLRYDEALRMADKVQMYKLIVKQTALSNGIYATFMPKPIFGENGSGMHTHQSLFKGDRNAFHDQKDKQNLSDIAKHYIAGVLKHAYELTSILNPLVNSYKRLVPGYEAPVYVAWARRNRSALVRVPQYKPGKEKATRIEWRSPDPTCNPYTAFAVMLAAGMEGMKRKYELTEPVEKNIFKMNARDMAQANIRLLPGSLKEAIDATEGSELAKSVLGDHMFKRYIEIKNREWDEFRLHVTDWELKRYLPIY